MIYALGKVAQFCTTKSWQQRLGKDHHTAGKDEIEPHTPQQQVNCSLNVRTEGRVMQDLQSKQATHYYSRWWPVLENQSLQRTGMGPSCEDFISISVWIHGSSPPGFSGMWAWNQACLFFLPKACRTSLGFLQAKLTDLKHLHFCFFVFREVTRKG